MSHTPKYVKSHECIDIAAKNEMLNERASKIRTSVYNNYTPKKEYDLFLFSLIPRYKD